MRKYYSSSTQELGMHRTWAEQHQLQGFICVYSLILGGGCRLLSTATSSFYAEPPSQRPQTFQLPWVSFHYKNAENINYCLELLSCKGFTLTKSIQTDTNHVKSNMVWISSSVCVLSCCSTLSAVPGGWKLYCCNTIDKNGSLWILSYMRHMLIPLNFFFLL